MGEVSLDYRIIAHDGTPLACWIDGREFAQPLQAVQYLMGARGYRLSEAMEYITRLTLMTE